jgi:hypothetical protein
MKFDPPPETGWIDLPNGCGLHWKTEKCIGGHRVYYSDEIGGGVFVWDTAILDVSTLLAAIVQEMRFQKLESIIKDYETRDMFDAI